MGFEQLPLVIVQIRLGNNRESRCHSILCRGRDTEGAWYIQGTQSTVQLIMDH